MGDEAFFTTLRELANRYAFQTATTEDFENLASEASGQDLGPFFIQWMDSTGASNFTADYVVYRTEGGFRVSGRVEQDMDVFSMPVEVEIETEGEPVIQRVQVTGRASDFVIETPGRPKRVIVDPNNRVLKYNDNIRLRVAVARGEQAVAQRDYSLALEEYQKALDINRTSSLAHYRVAEVFFILRNYQSAANSFREALNGDLEPTWTEVWSHISLGKIFDVTGQRDRAVNEYQQALRTRDESQGALDLANEYLQTPYERGQETGG
jgi:aminopeptidase N